MKKSKFRISSKKVFFTFSQCPLHLDEVKSQLKRKLNKWIIKDYILAIEKHSDNINSHIHAYVECLDQINTTQPSFFDLKCPVSDKIYHGNYQGVKIKNQCLRYILKDQDITNEETCLISLGIMPYITKHGFLEDFWPTIIRIAKSGDIALALKLLEEEKPSYYVKNHISIEKSLRSLRLRHLGYTAAYNFNTFIIPDDIKKSLEESLNYEKHPKSIYIQGDSGTGKTKLLESFFEFENKTPLIINHYDALKFFEEGKHDCILIDDMSFDGLGRETILKLFDTESEATFRVIYGIAVIPRGIPRYICSNLSLKNALPIKLEEAVLRRVKEINLGSLKLYKISDFDEIEIKNFIKEKRSQPTVIKDHRLLD